RAPHETPQHYCAPGRLTSFHGPFLMDGPFIPPFFLLYFQADFLTVFLLKTGFFQKLDYK
ncbi:hypothetical protein, partial [Escherichia coli]|uniref:hypothetical protein n=1 Tax=Escherichia coli TaxID=562 RepID=UPI00098ADB48